MRRGSNAARKIEGMLDTCPHCGQPMVRRFGVVLPPAKVRLLDAIVNGTLGRGGISTEELIVMLYPGVDNAVARRRIVTHVNQLNGWMAETDVAVHWDKANQRYVARGFNLAQVRGDHPGRW